MSDNKKNDNGRSLPDGPHHHCFSFRLKDARDADTDFQFELR